MTSGNWIKGMVAGFVATVVISALMLMKTMMGVMPELNPIKMMSGMLGAPPGGRLGDALHDRGPCCGVRCLRGSIPIFPARASFMTAKLGQVQA